MGNYTHLYKETTMYRLSHIHGAIVIHDDYEEEQAKVEFADDEPEKELNFDD